MPDDAYYYFLSARNVAAGRGPSVDGLNASNGWHPLWMLVNVPIFAPTYADQDTPVRIALALGAISDSLVGGLHLLRRCAACNPKAPPSSAGLPMPSTSCPCFNRSTGWKPDSPP